MMIDLKHVKTFLAIYQQGSFSAAAEALDIAQPTVSLHIKSLEKRLGYALFDRIGKAAIMTPAGTRFVPTAQEMIRLALEAQTIGISDRPVSGKLRLCIVQSIAIYRMPKHFRQFHAQFPAVHVNITVNRPSTYMLEQLRNGEFDASIVLEAPFEIPSLKSQSLWSDHLELVANPSHHLAKKSTIQYLSLQTETFIFPEAGAHYRRLFERRLQEHNVVPDVKFEVDNIEAIKQAVMAGLGIAVLPRYAIDLELASGKLVSLPIEGRKFKVTAQLIWHGERLMSDAARAFVEMMTKNRLAA